MISPLLMPTASSLERAERCPVSFCFAQVFSTNEDAEKGTAVHRFVSHVIGGMPREDALALILDKDTRATCAGIEVAGLVSDLGMTTIRSEVAYGLEIESRHVLEYGSSIERAYPSNDDTINGTIDLEGRTYAGRGVAIDLKSGFADTTDPALSRQMHFAAVVRRRALDVDELETRIAKIGESGKVKISSHVFDGFTLDGLEDDVIDIFAGVKDAHARMRGGDTMQVTRGPWCKFCPSKSVCPAHAALAREMLPDLKRVGGMIAGVMKMTPEEQFRVFELVNGAQKLIDAIKPSLKAIARHQPFRSADGTQEVRVSSYEKETFSRELAVALLESKGATAEELAALYSSIPIEAMRAYTVKSPKPPRLTKKAKAELEAAKAPEIVESTDATIGGATSLYAPPNSRMRDRANDR